MDLFNHVFVFQGLQRLQWQTGDEGTKTPSSLCPLPLYIPDINECMCLTDDIFMRIILTYVSLEKKRNY